MIPCPLKPQARGKIQIASEKQIKDSVSPGCRMTRSHILSIIII